MPAGTALVYFQLGVDFHRFSSDGVGEAKGFGAQKLVGDAQFFRERSALFTAILRVSQDRPAHMGAVNPQLVGAAGMRMKDNVNAAVTSDCCYFVSGYGFLTLLGVHFLSWSFVVVCTQ